jgi:transcriptional regulator with XRE-family HTH domain
MTQAALAHQAQLSPIFIAKVEAGERMPSWETLARLARPLNVAVRVALVPIR